jgi:hypothetical protein
VPVKTLQIETGFLYEHDLSGLVESEFISYNSTLLRVGLLKNFELRLVMEYNSFSVRSAIKPVDVAGWSPLVIGTKIYIVEEKGWRPEIAFLGHLTLPFLGNESLRPDYVVPDFRFSFSHTLGERFSLGYNLGLDWPAIIKEDVLGIYTISLGYSITDRLSCYLENYGYIDLLYAVDGGFTFLLKNNFQLDLYGGFGLSPDSPDYFVGAGFSWRIPR